MREFRKKLRERTPIGILFFLKIFYNNTMNKINIFNI